MPEIIDIMVPPLAKCLNFVVNNAVDFVTPGLPAGPWFAETTTGAKIFIKGDSFNLISAGIILPESFTTWKNTAIAGLKAAMVLQIVPIGISADVYFNPNFLNSQTFIPMENFEWVFDSFFDCNLAYNTAHPTQNLNGENFQLKIVPGQIPEISMQGVPAAMNGKEFRIIPFIKVVHNFALTI